LPQLYSDGTRGGWDQIEAMRYSKMLIDTTRKYAKRLYDHLKEKWESTCDAIAEVWCVPVIMGAGGCIINVLKHICEGTKFGMLHVAWWLLFAMEVTSDALDHAVFLVRR
jgi:hypothetical protein